MQRPSRRRSTARRCTAAGSRWDVGQLADAQRPEAVGIAGGDQLGVGHDDQAVGTLDDVHRLADGGLDVGGGQALLGQQITDHLGVGGAVKDGTLQFQLPAQGTGIDQVAVVADGHGALAVMQQHGLCIGPGAAAGGGVAHMAGGHLGALGQVLQNPLGEHFTHQTQVPVVGQHAVHIQGNAAAFLAAVLQGVQCAVYGADHVGLAGLVINAENAAFFMQCIGGGKFKHSVTSILKMQRRINPNNAVQAQKPVRQRCRRC